MADNPRPSGEPPIEDPKPGAAGDGHSQDSSELRQDAAPAATSGGLAPGVAAARRARRMGGRPKPYPTAAGDLVSSGSSGTDTLQLDEPADRPENADETESTADTDPVAPASGQRLGRPAPGVRRRRVAIGLALVVFLGLTAAAVWLARIALDPPYSISGSLNDQVLAAAKSDVPLITSYSYKSIDQDSAKAQAVLTGQFKKDYTQSINTVVKPQLPTTKTVAVGQVTTAGLESASTDGTQVVVVVFGQQSVTNVTQTTPRIDPFQLRVTMQKVGNQWLVAKLDQLGAA